MLISAGARIEPDSYTRRRDAIASRATGIGSPPVAIDYLAEEHATWSDAMALLGPVWESNAALALRSARSTLALPEDHIPQLSWVSERLQRLTGFIYASVPGMVSRAEFFGALAQDVFPSTQFIRWSGNGPYTPAPDVLHELGGHAIALANEHLAELHRVIGRAAATTNDPELLREIAAVFWYTVEFGVVREGTHWKACGAGLLSSPGELAWFADHAEIRPFSIPEMIATKYDISRYQPLLFGADSLEEMVELTGRFCRKLTHHRDASEPSSVRSSAPCLIDEARDTKPPRMEESKLSHLKKVDHITYACERGRIEKWAWFHIEIEGGTLINRIDDVRPDDPDSSMKIWCIDFGDFGIALIEGIDRAKKSQVTKFVERHGDHSCQHVAYDTHDLDKFITHLQANGGTPRGEVLIRNDGFGLLKQVFARGYAEGDAAEASFPEYCERPRAGDAESEVTITFAAETGKGFYDQIEEARAGGDEAPFLEFAAMPEDWEVPAPSRRSHSPS